ncbi:hypothetical protein, partial [Klebsiella pneumoniae]|uniref:hypothetical protein n=1 Tax=Klebsiella pneumoniae TaxID=573 RepID=UPI0040558C3A
TQFYASGSPTYWPTDRNKIPDLIDFFVGKGISSGYIEIKNCDDLSSDHSPEIDLSKVQVRRRGA